MKKLIVLGPGCPRCERLAETVKQVADEIGIEYEFEKITEITRFADFGVMMTPGFVVDGELKTQGKIPSDDEIKAFIE
ncbi:MAG: thioredoxin family protein [bacterium]|nr:thioredoxin family protein [bacterium]